MELEKSVSAPLLLLLLCAGVVRSSGSIRTSDDTSAITQAPAIVNPSVTTHLTFTTQPTSSNVVGVSFFPPKSGSTPWSSTLSPSARVRLPLQTIERSVQGKRGYQGGPSQQLSLLVPPSYSATPSLSLLLAPHSHQSPPHASATDIANRAAGKATAAAASQETVAYNAAQEATRKVAAQVSAAAQQAQAAAAAKYSQAGQLTQAAQIAQALVFREAAQAAKTGVTVQAAEAVQVAALSQLTAVQQAMAAAEAQVALAQQVLAAAAAAYWEQSATLKQAQSTAQVIAHQQALAVSDLSSAHAAAEKARAAATKALYKAHPVTEATPVRYALSY